MAQPASMRVTLGSRLAVASGVSHRWLAGPENHWWYIAGTIADGGRK